MSTSATSTHVTRSRIADARRRTRAVKVGLAAAALGAFVVTAGAARSAHPGAGGSHTASRTAPLDPPQRLVDELSGSFFGQGDVGPSGGGAPQATTRSS